MIKRLLLASAAIAFTAAGTFAADVTPPESTAGFFGYVQGGYIFETNSNLREFEGTTMEGSSFSKAHSGDGWDGSFKLGYRFEDNLDIAVGGRYFDQGKGKRVNPFDWQNTDGKYWNGDVEVGYSYLSDDIILRPFIGLRYQQWKSEFTDHFVGDIFDGTNKSWGIGPRLGFDASVPLSDELRLFGGADASVLFGKVKASGNYFDNSSDSRTFWTLGANLGLGWAITPSLELGAGYKVDWLGGINYATFSGENDNAPRGHGDELIHGPFARLSFSFP